MRCHRRCRARRGGAALRAAAAAVVLGAAGAGGLVVAPPPSGARALPPPPAALRLDGVEANVVGVGDVAWEMRQADSMFVVDLEVGGQKITAVPDTGSFSLMVTSKKCPESKCPFPRAYDPSASGTHSSKGQAHDAVFGIGQVWLEGATDRVRLPGFGDAKKAHFWEIVKAGPRMGQLLENFNAILGMSHRKKAPQMCETCPDDEDTLLEAFRAPAFTACLGASPRSYLYWGSAPDGSWTHLPVVSDGHWIVLAGGVRATKGSEMHEIDCWRHPCGALIDTGATDFYVPESAFEGIKFHLGVAADCSNLPTLPNWEMVLVSPDGSKIKVAVSPDEYVRQSSNMMGMQCELRIFPDPMLNGPYGGPPLYVLGVPFFQKYLVEFDRASFPPRLGIAPRSGECPAPAKAVLAAQVPGGMAFGSVKGAGATVSASNMSVVVAGSGRRSGLEQWPVIDAYSAAGLGVWAPSAGAAPTAAAASAVVAAALAADRAPSAA